MKLNLSLILLYALVLTLNLSYAQQDSLVFENRNRFPFNGKIDKVSNSRSNQIQVINAEQITSGGYTQLSEILSLSDVYRFNLQSENESYFSNQFVSPTLINQNWILMVNGQRIEHTRFKVALINQLGIAVNDVERIEIVHTPGVYLGEFNETGIIHIITKQHKNHVTARAFGSTTFGSPSNNLALQRSTNAIHLESQLKKWNLQLNYVNTFENNNEIYRNSSPARIFYPYQSTVHSLRAQASYYTEKQSHLLSYTQTLGSTYDITELRTGLPIEFNLPDFTARQLAYSAKWKLGNFALKYRSTFALNTNSLFFADYTHITNNIILTHQKLPQKKRLFLTTETGFTHEVAAYSSRFINHTDVLLKPYVSLNFPVGKRSNLFSDVSVTRTRNTTLPKAILGYYKNNFDMHNWSIVMNIQQRSDVEDRGYFYYQNIINPNSSLNQIGMRSQRFTIDYFNNLNLGKHFKFTFQSSYIQSKNEPYFSPELRLIYRLGYGQNISHTPTISYWSNRFNLHYDVFKRMMLDVNYTHNKVVSNSLLDFIPAHRFALTIKYDLPKSFVLWNRNFYTSRSEQYNTLPILGIFAIQPLITDFAPASPPPIVRMIEPYNFWETGITKTFGRDKHQVNISTRTFLTKHNNLFNERIYNISLLININGNFAPYKTKP